LEELVIVSVSTGTTCWYYYANGKLSLSEQHDENKKIGEWESYDSPGNWLKTEVYMNNTLIKTKDRKNYAPDK
jgi:antitoxin component YwqK of YwqJK toxin-antitoxin module